MDKWRPGQESNLIGRVTARLSPSASASNHHSVILFGGVLISLRASASEKRLSSNSAFHQLQSARVWGRTPNLVGRAHKQLFRSVSGSSISLFLISDDCLCNISVINVINQHKGSCLELD